MSMEKVVFYCGFVSNNLRQRTVFCAETQSEDYVSLRGVANDIKTSIKDCIKDIKHAVGTRRVELHIPVEYLKDVKAEARKIRLNTSIVPEVNEFDKCTCACYKVLYGNYSTEYLAYEMGAYKYDKNLKVMS